jgi:hypothetical protein
MDGAIIGPGRGGTQHIISVLTECDHLGTRTGGEEVLGDAVIKGGGRFS